jgi:hypothetical protein
MSDRTINWAVYALVIGFIVFFAWAIWRAL